MSAIVMRACKFSVELECIHASLAILGGSPEHQSPVPARGHPPQKKHRSSPVMIPTPQEPFSRGSVFRSRDRRADFREPPRCLEPTLLAATNSSREKLPPTGLAQSLSQTLSDPPRPRHFDVGLASNPDRWRESPHQPRHRGESCRDHRKSAAYGAGPHGRTTPQASRASVGGPASGLAVTDLGRFSSGGSATKRVDAYGLQLLTGDLVPMTRAPGRTDARRTRTVSSPPEI